MGAGLAKLEVAGEWLASVPIDVQVHHGQTHSQQQTDPQKSRASNPGKPEPSKSGYRLPFELFDCNSKRERGHGHEVIAPMAPDVPKPVQPTQQKPSPTPPPVKEMAQGPKSTPDGAQPSVAEMRPKTFLPGAAVEYFSQSQQRWIPAVVKGYDQATRTYVLDVHAAAEASRVRQPESHAAGDGAEKKTPATVPGPAEQQAPGFAARLAKRVSGKKSTLADPLSTPTPEAAGDTVEQSKAKLDDVLARISKDHPWEDASFPPTAESLCFDWSRKLWRAEEWRKLVWKRHSPGFRVFPEGGLHPADIRQGAAGDCYFLASLSSLAHKRKELAEQLIVTSPEAQQAGVAVVRLNWRGRWTSVVVSHSLPCHPWGQLAFSRAERGALWVPLVEKAWAKLHGSYQSIEAGLPLEALRAFTGAPTRHQRLEEARVEPISSKVFTPSRLLDDDTFTLGTGSLIQGAAADSAEGIWKSLAKAVQRGYVICVSCGTGKEAEQEWLDKETGLVHGHSYTLLDARLIGGSPYLLLRNPWGKGSWTGRNAQGDPQWPEQYRRCVGNGVFWMAYPDFVQHFQSVDICRLRPGFVSNAETLVFPTGGRDHHACSALLVRTSVAGEVSLSVLQPRPKCVVGMLPNSLWTPVGLELYTLARSPGQSPSLVSSSPFIPRQEVSLEANLEPGVDYLVVVRTPLPQQAAGDEKSPEESVSESREGYTLCTYGPGPIDLRPFSPQDLAKARRATYEAMARRSDQILFQEDGSFVRAWAPEHRHVFVVLFQAGNTPLLATVTWRLKNMLFQANAKEEATLEAKKQAASGIDFTREQVVDLPPGGKQLTVLTWLDSREGFALGYSYLAATKPCAVCGVPVGCPIRDRFSGEYVLYEGGRFGADGFVHQECRSVSKVAEAGLKFLRPRW
mmetsp:Transcript_62229/g.148481  ORF Transcript_62229/g.148481 Transcript_62229/m.148481 type:complete len:907 (-) Transcript_62229:124-2844(-)